MKNIKIALFDAKEYDRESFENTNRQFGFQIDYFASHFTENTAVLADGHDAVCLFVNDYLSADLVAKLKSYPVPLVALRSAGYNNVDLKATYRNIHVVRVPAYSPHAIAEHTVGLILSLNRKIHRAYYRTRDNNFTISGFKGFDMYEKTAGVIGTGKIGKVLIRILKGFGMHIVAYDPFPDKAFAEETQMSYVDLPTLYEHSDIISLNCPLTKETYHMIDTDSISRMKTAVMIINTGRGHLIDTQALIDGLKAGRIGSAGLDVYEEESKYFFEDFSNQVIGDDVLARLLSFNNVLITSHQGFFTEEALRTIAQTTLQNIDDFFAGRPLINEICYNCDGPECVRLKNGRCF